MLLDNNNIETMVSVITPTYNSERFISSAIKSVQEQTYSNWEMIIVDDCSADKTKEIIRFHQEYDNRIKLIELDKNYGPAIARNIAIENAKGRYIAFLDSDDQWFPDKLRRQIKFMQENSIAFSYTKYMYINEDGSETNIILDIPDTINYDQLLRQNEIGCLTVMLDRKMIGEVRMVNIRSRQDLVLWLDICKRGFNAFGLQEVLSKYRVVENSLSSNKIKMAMQNWKVYREIEKISLLKSLWYFMNYVFYKVRKYSKHKS